MRDYWSTEDADPIHLYSDVLVAIDENRKLDTGLPSLWADFFDSPRYQGEGTRRADRLWPRILFRNIIGDGRVRRGRSLPSIVKESLSSGPDPTFENKEMWR